MQAGNRTDSLTAHPVYALARPGYIILRQGNGMVSDFIARHYSQGHRVSHIGILTGTADTLMVVHAISSMLHTPGGVVCESLDSYIREADRGRIVLLCPAGADSLLLQNTAAAAYAMYRRRIPFDSRFDVTDTTAVFCSELVDIVLQRVYGKEAPSGGDALGFGRFFNVLYFSVLLDTACHSR